MTDDTPVARLRELAAKDCTECGGCDPIHPYCQRCKVALEKVQEAYALGLAAGGGAPVSTAPPMPMPKTGPSAELDADDAAIADLSEQLHSTCKQLRKAEKRAVQAESQAAQLADTWNEVAVKMDARAEQAERARDELLEALKGFKTVVSPWIRRPPTVTFKQWEAAVERIDAALVRARPAQEPEKK